MAYSVYRLVNEDERRIFIGLTNDLAEELARLRRAPPDEIAGWAVSGIRPQVLEIFFELAEARNFARTVASEMPPPGWQFVLDPLAG